MIDQLHVCMYVHLKGGGGTGVCTHHTRSNRSDGSENKESSCVRSLTQTMIFLVLIQRVLKSLLLDMGGLVGTGGASLIGHLLIFLRCFTAALATGGPKKRLFINCFAVS